MPITRAMLTGAWTEATPEAFPPAGGHRTLFFQVWRGTSPGDALRFRGRYAALTHIDGPDSGQVRVAVDGEAPDVRPVFGPFCTGWRLNRLTFGDGVHEVRVEIPPEAPDPAAILAKAGNAMGKDVAKYDGLRWHPGALVD